MIDDTLNTLLGIVPDEALSDNTTPTDDALAVVDAPSLPKVLEREQTAITVQSTPVDEKLDTDFEFAREKMRDLIKKGQEAVDSAIMLATSGDAPRAYEVVGNMIGVIIDANKQLIDIHKTKRDTQQVGAPTARADGSGGSVNIDKAVFVGRASDLLREIRALAASKVDTDAEKS
jgi:hypothetical protein